MCFRIRDENLAKRGIDGNDFEQQIGLKGLGQDPSDKKKRGKFRNSRMSSLISSYPDKNVLALSYGD